VQSVLNPPTLFDEIPRSHLAASGFFNARGFCSVPLLPFFFPSRVSILASIWGICLFKQEKAFQRNRQPIMRFAVRDATLAMVLGAGLAQAQFLINELSFGYANRLVFDKGPWKARVH
jgi:hypothetical protein